MKRLLILTINLALSQLGYSLDFRCGNARVHDADALKDFIELESRVYDQSLLYLEAFVERLSQPNEFCPMGAIATIEGAPNNTKACIFDQAQIPKIIEHCTSAPVSESNHNTSQKNPHVLWRFNFARAWCHIS